MAFLNWDSPPPKSRNHEIWDWSCLIAVKIWRQWFMTVLLVLLRYLLCLQDFTRLHKTSYHLVNEGPGDTYQCCCLVLQYQYITGNYNNRNRNFSCSTNSLQNKCRTADPDRQNWGRSGRLSSFTIYKFWQNCASVWQVSDLILKTAQMSRRKIFFMCHVESFTLFFYDKFFVLVKSLRLASSVKQL